MKEDARITVGSRKVAVIGAGVAGLSAAVSLAKRGIRPLLIEAKDGLGGEAAEFACKGIDQCVRCDVCLGRDLVREAKLLGIERIRGAKVASMTGEEGAFRIHLGPDLDGRKSVVEADSVIVSTGAAPYDPSGDKRLGFGFARDVISAYDAELEHAKTGRLVVPSTGLTPRSVAFVQCVGSRDERTGAIACSKVCCKYSLKLAQLLKRADPDISILYLFMDWRPVDAEDDIRLWAAAQTNVKLVRSRPAEIFVGEAGKPVVRYAAAGDSVVAENDVDLVLLSVGMRPSTSSSEICAILGLDSDRSGFVRVDESMRTTRKGVFAVGCCAGPKDIRETAKEGEAVAATIASVLEAGR
ncbi:MAG: FAD-dependent oxidoreductase [Methanomassiliicoccales archaeon]|nr:FAD-dependent oxidoreductase [Methanomassiliicoccales archaeon]